MKYCAHCGAELLDEAVICPKCGCSSDANSEMVRELKKNAFAIAGFVLSLVAMFINMYAIPAAIGLVLSIIGLIQINKGGYKNKGLAIAGIVLGVIALVYDIVYYTVLLPIIEEQLNTMFGGV